MKKEWRVLAGLVAAACMSTAHADADDEGTWIPTVDGELTAVYDSNVTRALYERDIIEDAGGTASLSAAWNFNTGLMSAATVRAFAEYEAFDDIDTLNRLGLGMQGIFRWQGELGFTAPFYQVSLSAQRDDVDAGLRDADKYTAQVFATKRLTDALRASAGIEGMYQEAQGRVFDLAQYRLFANADLALGETWAVYGTYSFIDGDTVSSAKQFMCDGTPATDTFDLISHAEEIELDGALNEALCGTWVAYRLPATTHVFVLGANRGFGHSLSFDVSAQHVMVTAEGDNEYFRTIVRAGILARF